MPLCVVTNAQAEVGLIITEGTTVPHPAASSHIQIPKFHDESLEDGLKSLRPCMLQGVNAPDSACWRDS